MAYKPGESGNPKGRPPKGRALTEILARGGSAAVEYEGKRLSGKRLVARLLWDIAKFGKCILPGDGKVIEVDADGWFDVVKFLYAQIDGPPKHDVSLQHSGAVDVIQIYLPDNLREQPSDDDA